MSIKNIIKIAHYYQIKYKFASKDVSQKVKAIFENSDPDYINKTLKTRSPSSDIQAGFCFLSDISCQ